MKLLRFNEFGFPERTPTYLFEKITDNNDGRDVNSSQKC